ncbi:MAG: right-handed parallel beta-helix repeat-containing protein, partial [Candidatus Thermoplasmatota archaeon]|nr:right-handed parallel beta-helix repeat-containing protein [Candidatus Thermoplasmatota archaeon]
MNGDRGTFVGTSIIPAALGVLALLVLAFLMDSGDLEVQGANFYNVQSVSGEKVVGLYKGPVWSGDIVAHGDVINITAVNESMPTSPTNDWLFLDIIVNNSAGATQYWTEWGMSYNGSGSEFTGNITLDKNLAQDTQLQTDGIRLRVENGFKVTLRKSSTQNAPLLYLIVDASGPVISPIEPGSSVAVYGGETYAKKGGSLGLQISDISVNQTWLISNNKVDYSWDHATPLIWNGGAITIPGTKGFHTLTVNATDKFNEKTTWRKTYNVTDFFTDTAIAENTTINSGVVFVSGSSIPEGVALTLAGSEMIFLDEYDTLTVNRGGSLSVTGSVIKSMGDHYTILSHSGSNLSINNSELIGAVYAPEGSSILVLGSGRIENVTFTDIPNRISIISPGVTISDSDLSFTESGTLYLDFDHRWGPKPTTLVNLSIEGNVNIPIQIRNVSTYLPYDLTTRYYEGDTSGRAFIFLDTTDIVAPYLKLPHFVDSRSTSEVFDIRYNNSGTWTSLIGYPLSDTVLSEWVNGETGRMDLSGLPAGGHTLNVSWNAPSNVSGCAHLGLPRLGGDNIQERTPGSASLNVDYSRFGTLASGDVLVLNNITVANARERYIHILSSGGVNISELHLGTIGSSMEAKELVTAVNSSILLGDSDLIAGNTTSKAVSLVFKAGDDWASSTLDGVNIQLNGTNDLNPAIHMVGGGVKLLDVVIDDAKVGVMASGGVLTADHIDINPTETGIHIELPSSYPTDMTLSIQNLSVGNTYSTSGLKLEGRGLDYDLNLLISRFEFSSSGPGTYTRSQGIGGLTMNLTSTGSANALISGNVTRGKGHGIAILKWPSTGQVRMEDLRIANVDLDGIYLGDGVEANISRGSISGSGLSGIYACDGAKVGIRGSPTQMLAISNIRYGGGVWMGDNVDFYFDRVNFTSCSGPAIVVGRDASGEINDVDIYRCIAGAQFNKGSTVYIYGLVVNGNSMGVGLWADSCNLTIGRITRNTIIHNNNGDGILIDGGSLSISRTWIRFNSGKGLSLQGVELTWMKDIRIEGNEDDGLNIHISSDLLLDRNGTYAALEDCMIIDNSGIGLSIGFDPTGVTKEIEILLNGPSIGGNSRGDIIAPTQVRFLWRSKTSAVGQNVLGSNLVSGVIRANLDIEVGSSAYAEMLNLNITLLGPNNRFHIMEGGTLRLEYCHVRPSQTTKRFSIYGEEASTVQVIGGYLGQLYMLQMNGGNSFYMDGTLIRFGEGPLMLRSTPFSIYNSEVSDIEGTGIMIIDGGGYIKNTRFTDNTIGIMVEGLSERLEISDSEFADNKWGISLFNDSARSVSITGSSFEGNSLAPIWTATSNANLLDTYIDPYRVQVTQSGYSVHVSYSLNTKLVNEIGQNVKFDLRVDRGSGKSIQTYENVATGFSGNFESYTIRSDDVYDDLVDVKITMTYEEGETAEGTPMMASITDIFQLDHGFSATYYGYQAPRKTAKFPGKLQALEDKGFKDGAVDISPWFTDIGNDKGNLTYSAGKLTEQIVPMLDGSMLTINLEKDWNGLGNITVSAVDPHGVMLTLLVNINVAGTNDQPVAFNPRIIALNSESPTVPRTGDTIRGTWEWHDIDGDPEPQGHIIKWFLNGTHVKKYDDRIEVDRVFAGQLWNFTLYPADNIGISSGIYGEPVHSYPVIIGNLPPTLSSVYFKTTNPTTLTDLRIQTGFWDDPETNVVTFNYLWERKTSTGHEALGAQNSPILDHRFTTSGDTIRVKVWVSDGIAISNVRTAEVYIRNSEPYIDSARLMPLVVDENTQKVYVDDLICIDPDGDPVTLRYLWFVKDYPIAISDMSNGLLKSHGNWNYPATIKVNITPYDENNDLQGTTLTLSIDVTPTDTDGDGLFDDANGNGRNDQNDDPDDDNDGYLDEWEIFLGTDPKDPLDKPLDSDGDGKPNGDPGNTQPWMDLDDDNDGVWDVHPENPDMNNPIWYDTHPTTASMPGDYDL